MSTALPCPGASSHLLGTAVKLENTYLAIMSRHVSVSSRWRFFKLSSAWAIELSSADPRLALVREVWILLEGEPRQGQVPAGAEPSTTGAKAQGMQVQRGSRSERPSRARGPLNHSLPKSGHIAPGGRQTGAYGQIQAGSTEQRPRRPGERLAPHQSRGELGDPFVAEQWSHAETRRPQNTDKDCILPPGLPWRTGRVWVPGEALHSPPHSAGQPRPATRRKSLCRSHPNTNFTPLWLSFAHDKLLKIAERGASLKTPALTPIQVKPHLGKPGSGWGPSQASASGWISELWDTEA